MLCIPVVKISHSYPDELEWPITVLLYKYGTETSLEYSKYPYILNELSFKTCYAVQWLKYDTHPDDPGSNPWTTKNAISVQIRNTN